ncbi:MAG: hypothetical protein ACI4ST_02500, partial [Candidatus Gallimonas sp.]
MNWFFAFITKMFGGIWEGIKSFFSGLVHIFDFGTYFGLFSQYQSEFGVLGWILAVLAFILVYAFWTGIVVLIVLLVRKIIRYRSSLGCNEDLLEEIAELHKDVARLTKEKERIIALKNGLDLGGDGVSVVDGGELELPPETYAGEVVVSADVQPPEKLQKTEPRFYRLMAVDEKYSNFVPPEYNDENLTLSELCNEIRNFACFNSRLFYEIKTIRLMIAGFASTKMILLQGISGTGKTSLPYVVGKYFESDATIASVQPSWRDRSELFGFYNEFTKKFNETE